MSPTSLLQVSYNSLTILAKVSYKSSTSRIKVSYKSCKSLLQISYKSHWSLGRGIGHGVGVIGHGLEVMRKGSWVIGHLYIKLNSEQGRPLTQ